MDNVKYIIIYTDGTMNELMDKYIEGILTKFIHIKNNKILSELSLELSLDTSSELLLDTSEVSIESNTYIFQIITDDVIMDDIYEFHIDILKDPEWYKVYNIEIIESFIGKILYIIYDQLIL
jgi:hypothetical protein